MRLCEKERINNKRLYIEMPSIHIQSFETALEAAEDSATKVSRYLREAGDTHVLFLMAGGSSFDIFQKIIWPHNTQMITLGVLDERYSRDVTVNNCAQLMGFAKYAEFCDRGGSIIDTRIEETETLEQSARKFEDSLRQWRTNFPLGKIIIVQGMGADGHTAGMMPYPENKQLFADLFEHEDVWVRGYDAGIKNHAPLRFTTTVPFLVHEVDASFMTIVGEEKSRVFHGALEDQKYETALAATPITVIKKMKSVFVAECNS